jgi:hypothetical protein
MQTLRRKPLLTLWQWAILFAIVPLWVIQLRYTIATIQNPTKAPLWRNLDFSHYYITAERVVQGKPQVYCSAFTPDETTHRGIETGEVLEPTNPPLLTLALTPIAFGNIF